MFSLLASGMPPVVFALGLVIAPPGLNDSIHCPIDPRPHPAPMVVEQQPMPAVIPPTASTPKVLVLSRGSWMLLQMTSKRPIVLVEVDREDVVRVVPESPTTLRVTALKTGVVRLTLHDDRGGVEKKQLGK
jgi:hypothetical protein